MFLRVLFSLEKGVQTATVMSACLKPVQVRCSVEEEGQSERVLILRSHCCVMSKW